MPVAGGSRRDSGHSGGASQPLSQSPPAAGGLQYPSPAPTQAQPAPVPMDLEPEPPRQVGIAEVMCMCMGCNCHQLRAARSILPLRPTRPNLLLCPWTWSKRPAINLSSAHSGRWAGGSMHGIRGNMFVPDRIS